MDDHKVGSEALGPGWREIALGLLAFAIVSFGGGAAVLSAVLDPTSAGLLLTSLPGFAGLAGFAVAFASLGSLKVFGVRKATERWVSTGLGLGLLAFLLKSCAVMGFVALTGQADNPADLYIAGEDAGVWPAIAATLLLGVFAPIGEELLFRGVITKALLRYGPLVGVVAGATVSALLHGLDMMLPAAVMAGLAAGEVLRRSGSVWPAVAVNVMFNLPTIPLMVMAGRHH